ncbi:8-oxo-dGTP diphosphatase [Patescibacteria group bacterium]|nr:8-oxo-dGTP diphosphatase [Patescibacteria group bacterium]MBU1448437.1 8-oxo-dGTP diphosphatase [Patescibacteria group bacterium]MBU2612873.1 8-oxo-dGTP diphosphatase [Patescibacteria group bacterium]
MKRTTLCYPIQDGKVLLAMKKRGFGAGKWNGPGGKVAEGESVEDACRRETKEETGVDVGVLEDRGVVRFIFECRPEWDNECRIFVTSDVIGEPIETEEMRPAWYPIDTLPFVEMWEDDAIWLDGVLAGGTVDATFWFDHHGIMLRWEKR